MSIKNKCFINFVFLFLFILIHSNIYSQSNWGKALKFAGTDARATAFDSPTLHWPDTSLALTIEAWINFDEHYKQWEMIAEKGPDRWGLYAMQGGTIAFYIRNPKSLILRGHIILDVNNWHHVAAVWDSSTGIAKIFIDGKIDTVQTEERQQLRGQDGQLGIGGTPDGNDPTIHATIDEVRISNIARYDEEFTPPNEPFTTDENTVTLYHFDEGSGIISSDASGNGNDLLLQGDPAWVDSDIPPISDVKQTDEALPSKFRLSQNYPNPFNPTTNIQYSIPKAGIVTLKVYNLIGEVVATLVSEDQNPGNYSVTFDGSNLASGVYLYTLRAGNFSQSNKLMLLK